MNKDWTDQLPDLLSSVSEPAPEGLWEAIQSSTAPHRHAVRWWVGGLSAAAAITLAVFLWMPGAVEPSGGGQLVAVLPDTTPVLPPAEPVTVPDDTDIQVVPPPVKKAVAAVRTEETAPPEEVSAPESRPVTEAPAEEHSAAEQEPEQNVTVTEKETGWWAFPPEQVSAPPKRKKIQISLSGGGYLAQAGTGSSTGIGLPSISDAVPAMPGVKSVSLQAVSRNQPGTTTARHSQGPRISLMVGYSFAPRWSVSTGVAFTPLMSDFHTTSGSSTLSDHRTYTYLGVPLYIQYKALDIKWFSLYASAGPMFETCIGRSSSTTTYAGEKLVGTERVSPLSRPGNYWSLNTAVGLQFQLFRHGALFLQPGLSWHFVPSGSVTRPDGANFYTTHPFAFDLSIGYRILLF